MEVANFHSGQILRKLREQSGLKENELAVALDCSIDDILDWEGQGVPEQHLPLLQQYFSVGEALFNHRIISEQMLEEHIKITSDNLDDLLQRESYKLLTIKQFKYALASCDDRVKQFLQGSLSFPQYPEIFD